MLRLLPRIGRRDRVVLGLVLVWSGWAVVASLIAGRLSPVTFSYVVAPILVLVGVAVGRRVAPQTSSRGVAPALLGTALVFLVGVVVTSGPAKLPLGYANANAAAAVQVLALCGLALLAARGRDRLLLYAASVASFLVVVLNRSVAGIAVAVPLALVVLLVLWRPPRRRWPAVSLGLVTMTAAAVAVLALARSPHWPAPALEALDWARKRLWYDALTLWRANPVTGGGPGSFRETSPLAVDPDTSTAHSSLLQVGSETGAIGVVLLALLVVAGLALACRGPAAAAVIGVAAWTALWVHSLADHLLEFTVVTVLAGMVLGWSGAVDSEQLDVTEGEGPGSG